MSNCSQNTKSIDTKIGFFIKYWYIQKNLFLITNLYFPYKRTPGFYTRVN